MRRGPDSAPLRAPSGARFDLDRTRELTRTARDTTASEVAGPRHLRQTDTGTFRAERARSLPASTLFAQALRPSRRGQHRSRRPAGELGSATAAVSSRRRLRNESSIGTGCSNAPVPSGSASFVLTLVLRLRPCSSTSFKPVTQSNGLDLGRLADRNRNGLGSRFRCSRGMRNDPGVLGAP